MQQIKISASGSHFCYAFTIFLFSRNSSIFRFPPFALRFVFLLSASVCAHCFYFLSKRYPLHRIVYENPSKSLKSFGNFDVLTMSVLHRRTNRPMQPNKDRKINRFASRSYRALLISGADHSYRLTINQLQANFLRETNG